MSGWRPKPTQGQVIHANARDGWHPTNQPLTDDTSKAASSASTSAVSVLADTLPSSKTPGQAIESHLFSHFSSANAVSLLVGQDEQKMIAHGHQLTQDSEFFTAAMKREWAEGQAHVIRLPDEDPATMAHYCAFIYSGKLFTEDITTANEEQIKPCFQLLASLYVSGERFLYRRLQAAIVKELLRLVSIRDNGHAIWSPSGQEVQTIYRGTPQGSPGRRLLVDLYVCMGAQAWMDYDLEPEFVVDVAKGFFYRAVVVENGNWGFQFKRPEAKDYL